MTHLTSKMTQEIEADALLASQFSVLIETKRNILLPKAKSFSEFHDDLGPDNRIL